MTANPEQLAMEKVRQRWPLTCGSLFAGIGGFDLGFERAGIKTIWQVEIDEYCRRVLARHFPDAERFGDIRECGAHNLKPIDIICGGFPCQPFSSAGRREGTADDRYLWPEMLRVIRALRPAFVVAENVAGLVAMQDGTVLDEVCDALAAEDYEILPPLIVPACAFGAPHRRDRVWILAHSRYDDGRPEHEQQQEERAEITDTGCTGDVADSIRQRQPGSGMSINSSNKAPDREGQAGNAFDVCFGEQWAVEPSLGRVAHGVPARVDRLKSLGNAVVPQIAEWIGRRIVDAASRLEADR